MVHKLKPGGLYLYADNTGARVPVIFIRPSRYFSTRVMVRMLDSLVDILVSRSRIFTYTSHKIIEDLQLPQLNELEDLKQAQWHIARHIERNNN